jgi:hypothetical protein
VFEHHPRCDLLVGVGCDCWRVVVHQPVDRGVRGSGEQALDPHDAHEAPADTDSNVSDRVEGLADEPFPKVAGRVVGVRDRDVRRRVTAGDLESR